MSDHEAANYDEGVYKQRIAALERALLWSLEEWVADDDHTPIQVKQNIANEGPELVKEMMAEAMKSPMAQMIASHPFNDVRGARMRKLQDELRQWRLLVHGDAGRAFDQGAT